ncbi:MAG: YggT family protein [Alphaproteobacteria bacterium]|nr:YggT family protein [Alphaproteobacteria bacterium]
MTFIILLLYRLLEIYMWAIIATVILSWLVAFDIVNTRNKWAYKFCYFMNELTRPPTVFLRKYIKPIGGLDLTPMFLIFGIYILQGLLLELL